jgi:glycosyltransferase involved in cell wall biosynthesis
MNPKISVVICTLNRDYYLRSALQSLVDQTLFREEFEILVIDNGSIDKTKEIATQEFAFLGNIFYVYEPQTGLNYARNTGLENSRGKYIAYLDDDAIASPQWLENILNVFQNSPPNVGCVGGKIDPLWESDRPEWLSDNLLGYLAILDISPISTILSKGQFLYGVNFAFDKNILQSIGGFEAGLDRQGKNLLSNGDIMVQKHIQDQGYVCFYDPQISVQHQIQASRLQAEWFYQRAYWQGISDATMTIKQNKSLFIYMALFIKAWLYLLGAYLISPYLFSNNFNKFIVTKCNILRKKGYAMTISGLIKLENNNFSIN